MASNEVSWQSAFWSMPTLAINSMMQPSGRVCGFDPPLRIYLRSSPILCAFDALVVLFRFTIYCCLGLSAPVAAKKVVAERRASDEEAELGGIRFLEQVLFLRVVCLPWTKVWGFCYIGSFMVMEVMNILSSCAVEDLNHIAHDLPERWMTWCHQISGAMAVLLHLALLAWVDLAAIPSDPKFIPKQTFRLIRFNAHFIVFLIQLPLMAHQSDAPTPSPNRRLGGLVMSMLLIFIL